MLGIASSPCPCSALTCRCVTLCMQVYPALEGVPDFVATNSSSDSPAASPTASPILSPAAAPGTRSSILSRHSYSRQSSTERIGQERSLTNALCCGWPRPWPLLTHQQAAQRPAACLDIYQLLIEGYMASLMPSPAEHFWVIIHRTGNLASGEHRKLTHCCSCRK